MKYIQERNGAKEYECGVYKVLIYDDCIEAVSEGRPKIFAAIQRECEYTDALISFTDHAESLNGMEGYEETRETAEEIDSFIRREYPGFCIINYDAEI